MCSTRSLNLSFELKWTSVNGIYAVAFNSKIENELYQQKIHVFFWLNKCFCFGSQSSPSGLGKSDHNLFCFFFFSNFNKGTICSRNFHLSAITVVHYYIARRGIQIMFHLVRFFGFYISIGLNCFILSALTLQNS